MRTCRVYDILKMAETNLEDFKALGLAEAYHEELKYLCCVNILECLKKTRDVNDRKLTEEFIDACFAFIRKNWPEFWPLSAQTSAAFYQN